MRNLWYFAVPGRKLKTGATIAKTLLGENLLLGRARDGSVFAMQDRCPHRAMPLSYGRFDGVEIECCYHGWRFGTDGRCTAIPSLVEGRKINVDRIRVRSYPCRDVQGNVWVFMGDEAKTLPDIPVVPEIGERAANLSRTVPLPCDFDNGIIGLIDPAHGAFVHKSWWWRSGRSIREKAKKFAPSRLGFTMIRHAPSRNSFVFKLLGVNMEAEISFELPGVRIETLWWGRRVFCGLTAVTPITEDSCEMNHVIYWTTPLLTAIKPMMYYLMVRFIDQDRMAMVKLRKGLAGHPKLMLINDADTQVKWYYKLKREFEAAQKTGRAFKNPVEEAVLHWRT